MVQLKLNPVVEASFCKLVAKPDGTCNLTGSDDEDLLLGINEDGLKELREAINTMLEFKHGAYGDKCLKKRPDD